MPLLIDGHNLIGQLPDIRLDDPHDEAKLVSQLKAYVARTGKRVTVVFDRGMPGGHSDLSSGRIEVVFAATGHTADGILRERIHHSRNPRGLIVVTSDRDVIRTAESRGARVLRARAFVKQLQTSCPVRQGVKQNPHLSEAEVAEWLELFGLEND
jgi:predicted RNA-binding protein with PIN domain